MNSHRKALAAAAVALAITAAPRHAYADLTRVAGATLMGVPDFTRYAQLRRSAALNFDDVAYDDKHNVFLQVWGDIPYAVGRFFGPDGTPIGPQFKLNTGTGNYGQQPYVAYSRGTDDDLFFVGFSTDGSFTDVGKNVFGQFVRFNGSGGTLIGTNFMISQLSQARVLQTMGGVAFNPTTHQFIATWDDGRNVRPAAPYDYEVWARVFNIDGTPATGDIDVSAAPTDQRAGGVTYDPITGRYGVIYKGETPTPGGFGIFARLFDAALNPVSGVLAATTSGVTNDPQIVYLAAADRFLMMWTDIERSGTDGNGRLLNPADGTFSSNIYPVIATPVFDGAPHGQFNDTTQTAMVAAMHDSGFAIANELNANGTPTVAPFIATQTPPIKGGGTFYPRIAAGNGGLFALTYMANYSVEMNEVWKGVVTGSGGGPGPNPPPTQPQPNPKMNVDYPAVSSTVQSNAFLISGWAIDMGATSGSGVDVVQAWAYPVGSQTAQFVGTAQYGVARPDVAAYVGGNFVNCGYALIGSLAPGAYDLYVFAHSTVTGTFNNVKAVRINVIAAPSNPRMWVDSPGNGATVGQNLSVAGWAIDLGSSSGTGVDAVHVWAYPTSGAPVLVGVAQYGISRPDIGTFAGNSRFAASGWLAQGTVPPGDYVLVAFAHSTVTGTFNNVVSIAIHVQ